MEETKANKLHVAKQIERLTSKPFFPPDSSSLAETLLRYSASQEHARRVIDAAVIRPYGEEKGGHVPDRCPGPADIAALCREIPSREAAKEAAADCSLCVGTGWIVVERSTGEGVNRCQCGVPPAADPQREYAPVGLGIRKEMP